jgi:hypothetical protein
MPISKPLKRGEIPGRYAGRLLRRDLVKLEVLTGVAKLPTKGSSLYGLINCDILLLYG